MKTNATSMLAEFKNFALKGNVIDLAIGSAPRSLKSSILS